MNDEQSKQKREYPVYHEITIDGQKYISTAAASQMTGYSQRYITKLITRKSIQGVHVGTERVWFVLLSSVEDYAKERQLST